jgi:hypothetical protein
VRQRRRGIEGLSDHAGRGHGVAGHHDQPDSDGGREERKKQLEADAQAQSKVANVHFTGLAAQKVKAGRVFVFEMLLLYLQQLGLMAKKRRRVACDLRILPRGNGGHRSGERLRASESVRCLNLRPLVLFTQYSAEQALCHPTVLFFYYSTMVVYALQLGN